MPPEEPHQTHQRVALSIVSTLYFSKKYIQEFCRRSAAAAERLVGHDYEIVLVRDDESYAANCVRINERMLIARGFPILEAALVKLRYEVITLEMSEFRKMDGGLSCLSLRF